MLALCREHRLEHRTKHIALRYFLARELQQRGQLRLAYVASEANTADIFTKALAPGDHQRFCTLLGFPTSAAAAATPPPPSLPAAPCGGRGGGAWRFRGRQEGICSTSPPPPFSSISLLRVQQWGEGMGVAGVANLLSPERLLHRPFSYLPPAAGAAVGGEGICSTSPPPHFSSIPLVRVQRWGGGDLQPCAPRAPCCPAALCALLPCSPVRPAALFAPRALLPCSPVRPPPSILFPATSSASPLSSNRCGRWGTTGLRAPSMRDPACCTGPPGTDLASLLGAGSRLTQLRVSKVARGPPDAALSPHDGEKEHWAREPARPGPGLRGLVGLARPPVKHQEHTKEHARE
ncbi:unnamed protein product [Closterium sp. NIES-54]